MSRIRNAITARERLAWYLLVIVIVLALVVVHAHWRLATVQKEFTMYVPPDLSSGAVIKPDMPDGANVYMYAHYVFKQINEWLDNGTTDYRKAIDAMRCYISPDFHRFLNDDYAMRRQTGELSRRRHVAPAGFYTSEHVKDLGNGTWYVWLDVKLEERVVGETVKDIHMRYPLFVYRDHRSCNALGLSLGGYFNEPTRIGGAL